MELLELAETFKGQREELLKKHNLTEYVNPYPSDVLNFRSIRSGGLVPQPDFPANDSFTESDIISLVEEISG